MPGTTVRRSVLPGGVRVVTELLPGVRSVSVGIWVDVGSRDESRDVAGAAHFLEHLLFKSTPTRSASDIARSVDAVGGELNAFTSKEHTCFYAHVLDEDLPLALEVLADVVLRGACEADDVELERGVVLDELAMRDDDPEDLAGEGILAALFGDHPLGRPVIGTGESVESMTRDRLHSFHVQRYQPHRMVVAVAGNVEHTDVVRRVGAEFADHVEPRRAPAPRRSGVARFRCDPRLELIERDGEQSHLCIGLRGFGRHDETSRWAMAVLNNAVGGGLSSRLFQEVREDRGLAYSVYSSVDTFADAGAFSVYAGAQPENLDEVARLILATLRDVADHGLTDEEWARSKGSLRGGLVLGLEDPASRMNRLGSGELNYGSHRSIARTIEKIDTVTGNDVRDVAATLLRRPMGVAVVGPYRGAGDLPAVLREVVG